MKRCVKNIETLGISITWESEADEKCLATDLAEHFESSDEPDRK